MNDNVWDKLAEAGHEKKASKFLQRVDRKESRQIEKIIKREVKMGQDLTVLDAGCGRGRWSFLFSEKTKKVIGIDLSEKTLDIAKRTARGKNIDNIEFKKANITDIEFLKDNSVDLSFLCITLQHIVDENNFRKAASELERVTKPGGRIAFIEIVKKHSKKRAGYIACRSPQEYREAFKNSQLIKHIGVECPYLKFIYRGIIRKILNVKKTHGDIRDEYALWDAMEKSRIRPLIYAGYYAVMAVGSVFSILSRWLVFLSPQRLMIFKVRK